MGTAGLASINPEIITWARKLRGLSAEELGTKQLTSEQIKAWEARRGLPTHAQAEQLATKLRIPFLVLFLSNPPDLKVPIPDLRTLTGERPLSATTEFIEVINEALTRQTWYKEFLQEIGKKRLAFVGKFSAASAVSEVAEDIRRVTGIDESLRQASNSWEEFLRSSITAAERVGVLVFRSAVVRHDNRRKLSVKEFRGFVLTDDIAPMVFINDDDAKAAQIFTLAHELAHVWIGITGIPELDLKKKPQEAKNQVERFCNQVAAELLVPQHAFLLRWDDKKALWDNVKVLVSHFRVSSLVVLRRAYEFNKINFPEFSEALDGEYERFRRQDKKEKLLADKKKKSGGNFWASFVIRNSARFTETVVEAAQAGRVRFTDAGSLLGVKASTIERYITRAERG